MQQRARRLQGRISGRVPACALVPALAAVASALVLAACGVGAGATSAGSSAAPSPPGEGLSWQTTGAPPTPETPAAPGPSLPAGSPAPAPSASDEPYLGPGSIQVTRLDGNIVRCSQPEYGISFKMDYGRYGLEDSDQQLVKSGDKAGKAEYSLHLFPYDSVRGAFQNMEIYVFSLRGRINTPALRRRDTIAMAASGDRAVRDWMERSRRGRVSWVTVAGRPAMTIDRSGSWGTHRLRGRVMCLESSKHLVVITLTGEERAWRRTLAGFSMPLVTLRLDPGDDAV